MQHLSRKYKKYIDDIVKDNPFKADIFTEQLQKKILAEAKYDISRAYQYIEKMGNLAL